jgi:hypothetical protein
MAQKEITKDIKSAAELEQQLLISYAQKGVCVLDIYSSEWGPCKAISETFRRLYTDAGDSVHLRFFTVECNQVLESLKNPESHRHQRPKNTEAIKDSLPDFWQPILLQQKGKSKPFFLFYKEGKKMSVIEGVDTPAIRSLIKDLCTVKTPASEFITNSKLQEMWDEQFNSEESEVPFEKFIKGLQAHCKLSVNLNDDEKRIIMEALGLTKDAKERIVTADALQKWIGEDESNTVPQAVKALLPDYDDRAAQVTAERDAEEKRRREEQDEAKKRQQSREEEERRQREEQEKNDKAAKLQDLEDEIARLMKATEHTSEKSARNTAGEAEAAEIFKGRAADAVPVPSVPPTDAVELPAVSSLWSWLATSGADLRISSHTRGTCASLAEFAAKLLTCTADQFHKATGGNFDMRANWGSAISSFPAVVAAALEARSANTNTLYIQSSKPGDVVLSPLTPLFVDAGEGRVAISGVPFVIALQNLSVNNDSFAALPWFAKIVVTSDSATFTEFVQFDAVQDKLATAKTVFDADDEKLTSITRLRAAIVKRNEIQPREESPETTTTKESKPAAPDSAAAQEEPPKASTPPPKSQTPADNEAKPQDAAATSETKPQEAAPAEAKPAPAAEAKPQEATPAEAKPQEATPAEAKPQEAAPATEASAAPAAETPKVEPAAAPEAQPAAAPAAEPAQDAQKPVETSAAPENQANS